MLKHRSTSSLIPLLLPIVFGSACLAQEDPFAVPDRQTAPVEQKSQPSSPIEENEQLKSFRAQLATIEATYADMSNQNRAYLEMIERLTKQNNLNRLQGKSDDEVKDVFNQMEKQNEELRRKLDMVVQQNDALKQRVAAQEKAEAELRSLAKNATENRNLMHQQLFETLLYSEDSAQQELAIKHFFACTEESGESPISASTSKILRRIIDLTQTDSATTASLAARCLWAIHPNSARELGIQFGSKWRPVEYSKGSIKTAMIHDVFDKPIDMVYEEEPLSEIIETIQIEFGIGVRLEDGIDADQPVTYESIGRPFFQTFSNLLTSKKLGLAVVDDEIRIMKETNPALMVDATYNVAGLESLGKIKTDELLQILKESFSEQGVKFAKLDSSISAKTTERTQRKIQEKIASLAPPL